MKRRIITASLLLLACCVGFVEPSAVLSGEKAQPKGKTAVKVGVPYLQGHLIFEVG